MNLAGASILLGIIVVATVHPVVAGGLALAAFVYLAWVSRN